MATDHTMGPPWPQTSVNGIAKCCRDLLRELLGETRHHPQGCRCHLCQATACAEDVAWHLRQFHKEQLPEGGPT